MSEVWTPLRVLEWTTERFRTAGQASPRLEAEVLLAHVLGCDRVALYTGYDKPLAADELAAYRELIKRRLAGEPSAYLRGQKEFWSLPLRVDRRVLIPRPETETLVQTVIDFARTRGSGLRIAEVATGSGAVAIALARELPEARLVATDADEGIVSVARENAEAAGVSDRVELRVGDLLNPLGDGVFDVLVANLPYIPSAEIDRLAPEVRHEPRAALDGGVDGLDYLRRLIRDAARYVAPGGLLALEHGFDQAGAVTDLIAAAGGFELARTENDLAGQPRVSAAVRRADGA